MCDVTRITFHASPIMDEHEKGTEAYACLVFGLMDI